MLIDLKAIPNLITSKFVTSPDVSLESQLHISNCLQDISTWMAHRYLKFKMSSTELLSLHLHSGLSSGILILSVVQNRHLGIHPDSSPLFPTSNLSVIHVHFFSKTNLEFTAVVLVQATLTPHGLQHQPLNWPLILSS